MCATCGCSGESGEGSDLPGWRIAHTHDHPHDHPAHDHGHEHDHDHPHRRTEAAPARVIDVERRVLEKNDRIAERNRGWFSAREVVALNLVSSPGAGKTTVLERTLRDLSSERAMSVIEGDQETTRDADRIRATGAPVVQINTGTGCHLDASMIARVLPSLALGPRSLLFIENVGNLVCPALFDLGERAKVLIASVTEGEDKPLKYPHMLRASELVLLNKIDLLPHLCFDVAAFKANVRAVKPTARVIEISATTGEGLDAWYGWLRDRASEIPASIEEARP